MLLFLFKILVNRNFSMFQFKHFFYCKIFDILFSFTINNTCKEGGKQSKVNFPNFNDTLIQISTSEYSYSYQKFSPVQIFQWGWSNYRLSLSLSPACCKINLIETWNFSPNWQTCSLNTFMRAINVFISR